MNARRILPCVMALLALLPSAAQAQDSGMRRIQLDRDTVVDGIHCAPTGRHYAEFHASGRLAECPLADDVVMGDHHLPGGTWLVFDEAGRLRSAWLSRDTRLQDHLCMGMGYRKWSTAFHPSGALRSCYLADVETIQGVPCRKGTFWGEITGRVAVAFHDNGRLASCGTARAVTIDDIRFRRWQRVHLNPAGRPIQP